MPLKCSLCLGHIVLGFIFLNLSCEAMVLNKLGVVDYVCSTGRVVVGMTQGIR
jgi:hypothetical protein